MVLTNANIIMSVTRVTIYRFSIFSANGLVLCRECNKMFKDQCGYLYLFLYSVKPEMHSQTEHYACIFPVNNYVPQDIQLYLTKGWSAPGYFLSIIIFNLFFLVFDLSISRDVVLEVL